MPYSRTDHIAPRALLLRPPALGLPAFPLLRPLPLHGRLPRITLVLQVRARRPQPINGNRSTSRIQRHLAEPSAEFRGIVIVRQLRRRRLPPLPALAEQPLRRPSVPSNENGTSSRRQKHGAPLRPVRLVIRQLLLDFDTSRPLLVPLLRDTRHTNSTIPLRLDPKSLPGDLVKFLVGVLSIELRG